MPCTSPRTVGFKSDGKTLSWFPKTISKEFSTFQLPCGKCIDCRLKYSNDWAVRCVHESQMHSKNSFITLTYSEENIGNRRLNYIDFQLFIKRLRKKIFTDFLNTYGENNWKLLSKDEKKIEYEKFRISVFVTGEYGDITKRPHWHVLIFNWTPNDLVYKYTNHQSDRVYNSDVLDSLWGKGITEVGSVTYESAAYCARYSAKKLVHGKDQDHDYHPISKKSSHCAIGKTWIKKHWTDVFNYGYIVLTNGKKSTIPRYYEKWLKKELPQEWEKYITKIKSDREKIASIRKENENKMYRKNIIERGPFKETAITGNQIRKTITEQKFKRLTEFNKL